MLWLWTSSGRGNWIAGSLILALALMLGIDRYVLAPGDRVWPVTVAFVLSGLFSIALGFHARFTSPRLILERHTGRELVRRPVHSLYWIRAEYWGVLFFGLAILLQSTARTGGAQ